MLTHILHSGSSADQPRSRLPSLAPVAVPLLLLLLAGGCARYEFVVVAPVDRIVPDAQRVVVSLEPLEYRMTSLEDEFLIVRVSNPSEETVYIIDDRSYVVDPDGETHPLGGGIIAPHASTTLVLPPPPKVYQVRSPYGSRWRFGYDRWYDRPLHHGAGRRFGDHRYHDPFYYDRFYDYPRTYYVTEYPPGYWEWKTGRARLHLAYRKGDATFDHQLVFLRRRVK